MKSKLCLLALEQRKNMNINITDTAANEVARIINENMPGEGCFLRVRVVGGGCSGFQNKLAIDDNFNETTDSKITIKNVDIVVDKRSSIYLDGATIDFNTDINNRGFIINNPAAKSTCGCGSSYSM